MIRFRKQPESIETRVQRGMNTLDQSSPGWHRNINLNRLNIARADNCALGQTFGSYREGLIVLGIGGREAAASGFQTDGKFPALTPGYVRSEFEALTDEWDRQIRERRLVEREEERAVTRRIFFRKTRVNV